MPAADLPPDEEERLQALHELELLDTEPEEEFDELVRRAAEATGAPIAVITLVDEARQWFKARVNLELESTDRDLALENVRYVRRAAGRLGASFRPEPDGFVAQRARQVLGEALDLLRKIGSQGLLNAIAEGTFGVTKRPADGGRGLDGVVKRADGYYNPAAQLLEPAGMLEGAEVTR